MTFTTLRGYSIEEGLKRAFSSMSYDAERSTKIGWAVAECIKDHISRRFPGSQHWDPSKVSYSPDTGDKTRSGDVVVDIAGASRAYHDIDIFPIKSKNLAIPLTFAARNHSPRDFQGLFKPKGKNVLMMMQNGALVAMYALSQHVHQRRDPSLMPSDDTIAKAVSDTWTRQIDEALDKALKQT